MSQKSENLIGILYKSKVAPIFIYFIAILRENKVHHHIPPVCAQNLNENINSIVNQRIKHKLSQKSENLIGILYKSKVASIFIYFIAIL